MRTVAQVLELALSLLDTNPYNSEYMCCHLDWLFSQGLITMYECDGTQAVIRDAIGNNVTLAGYLRETGAMPKQVAVRSPEFSHYQLTFYRGLISKL